MKRLRWFDYINLNLFWLGLNIRNNSVNAIFMPYLVDMFVQESIKNTALGAMRTAGLLIAMVAQPAFGLLSDRSTSRWGRRRPYLLVGVLFDLVFLAAIGLSWNYWSLLVATLLIQVSSNVSHGPLQGLIPDLVPEDQRGRASAVKAIFELLPLVLLGMTIAVLVSAGRLTLAIAATGGSLLIILVLTLILVREEPLREKPTTPFWPPMLRVLGMLAGIALGAVAGLIGGGLIGGLTGLIAWPLTANSRLAQAMGVGLGGITAMAVAVIGGVWAGVWTTLGQEVRRQAAFTWWVVNRLMYLAAAVAIQSFAPFFLMYAFRVPREVAAGMNGRLMTMVGLCTLLSALPGGWLGDRLGHKRLVAFSGVLAAVGGAVLLTTIWTPNLALIYVVGAIIGLATGLFMTANWALGTELVPPEEAGRYLGISNLAGAGAGMIGTGIGGPVADFMNHYRPGLGYFAIFAGYAVLFLLSTVTVLGVRQGEDQSHTGPRAGQA
ncbi:MAG: MFS transporter [Anaerolineae bacterium]